MNTQNILIIATSGRMLAQMVKGMGGSPVVIDCFADQDTHDLSLECIQVDSLALESIQTAFFYVQKKYAITECLYGSGFESYLDSLVFLQKKTILLGNSVDVFASIQNKVFFFNKLKQLNIPHPPTLFSPPKIQQDFLIKPIRGEGGGMISLYQGTPEDSNQYFWQQKMNGISLSVLFVANGKQSKIYGFHKQLCRNASANDYAFAGVVNVFNLSDKMKDKIRCWVHSLVNEFSLKGLNSMDFIAQGEECFVLEVNPRPSASMQLYPFSLIAEHIDSIKSENLQFNSDKQSFYKAYKIIFATSKTVIRERIKWPEWVIDTPQPKTIIHTGMPICSIIAGKKTEQQLIDVLQFRQQYIFRLLK